MAPHPWSGYIDSISWDGFYPETAGVIPRTMSGFSGTAINQGSWLGWNDATNVKPDDRNFIEKIIYGPLDSEGNTTPGGGLFRENLGGVGGITPETESRVEAETGIDVDPTGANANFFAGFDFGSVVARISIIVLGFIFVAVGLSMFGVEPIKAAVAKISQ